MAEDGMETAETNMHSKEAAVAANTESSQSKRKRRKKNKTNLHILNQRTIRSGPWTYLHLQYVPTAGTSLPPALDDLTVQLSLNASLSQFLGLHGTAIRFDILKIDGRNVIIRIAAPDRRAVLAAVGGTRGGGSEDGWTVKGWSSWDAGVGIATAKDLFDG